MSSLRRRVRGHPPPSSGLRAGRLVVIALVAVSAVSVTPVAEARADDEPHPSWVFEDEYRRGLAEWASGDPASGAERLAALYVTTHRWNRCRAWLERNSAELLARRSPELVVPVVAYHLAGLAALSRRHVALPAAALTGYAELIEEVLAADPGDRAGGTFDRAVAARTLLVVAATASSIRLPDYLERVPPLADQARELDPATAPLALALIADSEEKRGRPRRAAEAHRSLLALEPDDRRARFGLALNLLRAGREAAALPELADLSAEGPSWIRALALFELARYHLDEDDPERAAELLRRGITGLPDEPQIAILLARVAEPDRAAAEPALADALAGAGERSPRLRYDAGPEARLAQLFRRFDRDVETLLPELAAAVVRLDDNPLTRSYEQACVYVDRSVEEP